MIPQMPFSKNLFGLIQIDCVKGGPADMAELMNSQGRSADANRINRRIPDIRQISASSKGGDNSEVVDQRDPRMTRHSFEWGPFAGSIAYSSDDKDKLD